MIYNPTMTEQNWLHGFTLDAHPEKEIRLWEICAKVYMAEKKVRNIREMGNVYIVLRCMIYIYLMSYGLM